VAKDLWIKIMKNIGRCHFKLGENGKSLEKFNEILSADPKNMSVLDLKVINFKIFVHKFGRFFFKNLDLKRILKNFKILDF